MVGENYAQELIAKVAVLRSEDAIVPQVHFIGQLQTNKVRQIAGIVDVWQSVDRTALIDEIVRRAPGAKVFVQVNSTEEDGKGGCSPADVGSLVQRCRAGGLGVEGLMTIGPTSQDGSETKRAFMLVRGLADDNGLTGCSMGMSDDMAIAVESGATHVRIGSAIFGTRPHPQTRIG